MGSALLRAAPLKAFIHITPGLPDIVPLMGRSMAVPLEPLPRLGKGGHAQQLLRVTHLTIDLHPTQ
ncbi:Uncharacterised protein [Acinetobacter baumannii]|nr:Uncharacterised protein [Acinetobacter baumannii]